MARYTTWMGTGDMSLDPVPDLVIKKHKHSTTNGHIENYTCYRGLGVAVDVVFVTDPLFFFTHDDGLSLSFLMYNINNCLALKEYHPWCSSGHHNASFCSFSCFLLYLLWGTPVFDICSVK